MSSSSSRRSTSPSRSTGSSSTFPTTSPPLTSLKGSSASSPCSTRSRACPLARMRRSSPSSTRSSQSQKRARSSRSPASAPRPSPLPTMRTTSRTRLTASLRRIGTLFPTSTSPCCRTQRMPSSRRSSTRRSTRLLQPRQPSHPTQQRTSTRPRLSCRSGQASWAEARVQGQAAGKSAARQRSPRSDRSSSLRSSS